MRVKASLLLAACLFWPQGLTAQATDAATAVARAHAHNDYEHARPLQDALDQGFASVEADVWLVGGRLLVAHDRDAVRVDRTLEALYLDPLRDRVGRNGGRVYRQGGEFLLWIDVKSEAESSYATLRETLVTYAAMLTKFEPRGTTPGAVTVVISGNRARETMTREPLRYAGMDGRLPDLDGADTSPFLIPIVSDNWQNVFTWRGVGPFPDAERERLRTIVARVHQQGRTVRFWAIPDTPEGWQVCLDEGVDLINTDDLAGLRAFLTSR